MNDRIESVLKLSARLPELLWKLDRMAVPLHANVIPQGMFRSFPDITAKSCIDEIKYDLERLQCQANERSARYLAECISRKINFLVVLCLRQKQTSSSQSINHFGIKAISTRQQWLASLQDDIMALSEQHQALTGQLRLFKEKDDLQSMLTLRAEIGEIERRLTLAREMLSQA